MTAAVPVRRQTDTATSQCGNSGIKCLEQVHEVYVDEVQRLSLAQLLALRSLRSDASTGFTFAGDPAQANASSDFLCQACPPAGLLLRPHWRSVVHTVHIAARLDPGQRAHRQAYSSSEHHNQQPWNLVSPGVTNP